MKAGIDAVLFDLDGTLVDSAPDLAAAINHVLQLQGRPPLPYSALRPLVGTGARGMVGAAFGLAPGDAGYEPLRDAFLARYAEHLVDRTAPFAGIVGLLAALQAAAVPWGIVTNKASRFSQPLVAGLPALQATAVLVSGDTTPHAKPHPAPLLAAASQLQVAPARCVYVGDDHRDIVAGQAAGMATAAAAWGYLGVGESIDHWGADVCLAQPQDLLNWLELA